MASLALLFTTFTMLVYLSIVAPYKNCIDNKQAISNELLLALFIILILNGDMINGLISIAFVMLVICVNVIFMLGNAFG